MGEARTAPPETPLATTPDVASVDLDISAEPAASAALDLPDLPGDPVAPAASEAGNVADSVPRPDARVAARIEELLREQLEEMGVAPASLSPQDIAEGMLCGLGPNNSMTYAWRGTPILHIIPEIKTGDDAVLWRMFTHDDMPDFQPRNAREIPGPTSRNRS